MLKVVALRGAVYDGRSMPFSDLALSRRLERAEGFACAQHAEARRYIDPESRAEWIECAGAYAVFNGKDSPVTQSFGLGLFEELLPTSLDVVERFFIERGAPVLHEVSPFAGVATLELLCSRSYRPIEISNVLYRPVEQVTAEPTGKISVRVVGPEEANLWASINARGWAQEHPELLGLLAQLGSVMAAQRHAFCFLAELEGKLGAAGTLWLHDGVALFGGSATIPELRRRGLHNALLHGRMRYALNHGCDLAMMVAEPGSSSQRNAEREGFRIAYSRTKWRLNWLLA